MQKKRENPILQNYYHVFQFQVHRIFFTGEMYLIFFKTFQFQAKYLRRIFQKRQVGLFLTLLNLDALILKMENKTFW